MRIVVSFDTEDFTDPAANDVLLEICRLLTGRQVRACFGIVGEKARFIRDQGRADLIDALAVHEIGYHSDNHWLFPDPLHEKRFASRIVEECDWDEAIRWLIATESRGLDAVENLFGRRPTTFLRTCGDSAAQILAALHRLGLKTYAYGLSINERTRHIARYANMLCVSLPLLAEELTYSGRGPERLDQLAAEGADLINVRFHPCRFLSDEWWSNLNYRDRTDPPTRPPYTTAPHLSPEETAQRLTNLGALIDYACERHGATFLTYGDLNREMGRESNFIGRETVLQLAREMRQRLFYARVDGQIFTLAETFAAITWALLHPEAPQTPFRHPLGPVRLPEADAVGGELQLSSAEVARTAKAVEDHIVTFDRLPDTVELSGRRVAPAAFLRVAANSLLDLSLHLPEKAPVFPEGSEPIIDRWEGVDHDLVAHFPERHRPVPATRLGIQLQYWSYKPLEM